MKHILTFLFFVCLIPSCNTLPEVGIKRLGFGDEVDLLQNLLFEFDEDLVSEGDLNEWESVPYIDFEPKIQGKFKWIGKNELIFSPTSPLQFATSYKASLSEQLLKRKKGSLAVDKEELIEFRTPSLKVTDQQAYATVDKNHKKSTRVMLDLNSRYDTHTIKDEVVVFADNKLVDYEVVSTGNPNDLVLNITDNLSETDHVRVEIAGKKGNPAKFQEKETLEIPVPEAEKLEILKFQTSFKKLKGYILVKTSQTVDAYGIEKYIEITPAVKFEVEQAENGFLIKGDFNQDDIYKIRISPLMSGILGGKMDSEYVGDAYFGKIDPYLEFTNRRAQYISSKGYKNIGVNIVNIPKVRIKISKVYENNLLPFIRSSYQNYDEEGEGYRYFRDVGLYSDELSDKKIESTDLPSKQGVALLNLPLPEQRDRRGVYFISVGSEDEYYHSIQKLVSVSDIGLISKLSRDQETLTVFANSILTTESLQGIEIKLVSTNNQEITKGVTDKTGMLVFKNLKKEHPGFTVAMITASTNDDFNYILFEDTEIETSKFDVGGRLPSESGYEAFIYGDREIYRPGETVYFNTVIRNRFWEARKDIPIKIKVRQPRGKEISSVMTQTNAAGAVEHSVKLDRAALTGFYTIEILTGNDVLIGSKRISVEDFMPDRIKVQVDGPESVSVGQKANIKITATNLFGPPASNKTYEMEYAVSNKAFTSKGYEDFHFGIVDQTKFEKELRNGTTDAKGMASEVFEIPKELSGRGMLEGKVLVSVFDESNRPVHRMKTFNIYTQQEFLGIHIPSYFTSTNVPYPMEVAALDAGGKPVTIAAMMEVYLLDYQTVMEKTENGLRYVSKKKEKLMKSVDLTIKGRTRVTDFIPKISGEYEVRLKLPDAPSYVASTFYAYGYGNRSSFEVDTDGEVQITTDKESYAVGEEVNAIFKTPFDGKLLITVENEGLLEHQYIQTEQKSASIKFKLKEGHLPNVYVSATLIRPMNQPELPLMSAHGLKSVKVDDENRKLKIEIRAQAKIRSKTHQVVEILSTPNTELTVAVVDEGILQLKNTETPDIYKHFYQKRALETRSFDLYPLLLPEIQLNNASKTGGDGGMSKRVNPLANGRAELVAKWSGILKTDASGKAKFEYDVPEFLGSLRVMAVAYDDKKFGSAQFQTVVSDPVSISVGLPLFLSPEDKVKVPVTFFNTTSEVQTLKISASTDGKISAGKLSVSDLTVGPGKEGFVELDISSADGIGLGKLKVMARNGKELFSKSTEISVRPAASLQKSGTAGMIDINKELTFAKPEEYMKGTLTSRVYISPTPILQFGHRLENLLSYPYGCTEQTISKAFAQLYFEDIAGEVFADSSVTESGKSERNPRYNVQSALEKIQEMQIYDGSLPYWPGNETGQWWVTAYALHFVVEAQKAGYDVSKDFTWKLRDYLNNMVNREEQIKEVYYTVENKVLVKKERIPTELAYSLYVLSLTDEPYLAGMNELKTKYDKLSQDQKFLLACAYMQIGDSRSYAALLPKTYTRESYSPMLSGSFSSPLRNMALVLNTLVESDPKNAQIVPLTQSLNTALMNKNVYLNTQELAFSLNAFGKLLNSKKSNSKAEVIVDGKVQQTISKKGVWIDLVNYPKGIKVKASGDKMYYYQVNEGIPAVRSTKIEDKGLMARRAYFTRDGKQITTSAIEQNQLVVVRLTLNSTPDIPYALENVVLTDIIPAGLEIENPRLTGGRDMDWIKNAAEPQYFDIRDDRIHFFVNVTSKPQYYYYLVRAITQGSFIQGPVSADAMYNPYLRSYWGGGRITVN